MELTMASREYIGSGGLTLTLDDPLSPEMAKQVATGKLRPVDGKPVDVEAGNKTLIVGHGSEANTATHVGARVRPPGEKPGADATAGQWATYAVALGLEATQASTLSLTQLQQWVAAYEAAQDAGETAEEPAGGERPAKNAPVADWRAYAVSLGMDETEAATATKTDCQDYAQVVEDAREQAEGQE